MSDFLTIEENLRCAMRFFGQATGSGEVKSLDGTVAMMALSIPISSPASFTLPPLVRVTPGWAPKTISVRPTRI